MIYIVIITVVLVSLIYVLYRIGKKVKEKESLIEKMIKKSHYNRIQTKMKRKSTPKVPTIHK